MRDIRADINACWRSQTRNATPLEAWKLERHLDSRGCHSKTFGGGHKKPKGVLAGFSRVPKRRDVEARVGLRYLRILTYRNGRARLTTAVSSPLLSFFRLNRPLEMNFSSSKKPRREEPRLPLATGQRSYVIYFVAWSLRISCTWRN